MSQYSLNVFLDVTPNTWLNQLKWIVIYEEWIFSAVEKVDLWIILQLLLFVLKWFFLYWNDFVCIEMIFCIEMPSGVTDWIWRKNVFEILDELLTDRLLLLSHLLGLKMNLFVLSCQQHKFDRRLFWNQLFPSNQLVSHDLLQRLSFNQRS